jgi:hypothetical protein
LTAGEAEFGDYCVAWHRPDFGEAGGEIVGDDGVDDGPGAGAVLIDDARSFVAESVGGTMILMNVSPG